jgi:hypothetical protein
MFASRLAGSLAVALVMAVPARAQPFEAPPSVSAEAVLGSLARGANYRVDPEVRSDGLLRLYVLQTGAGTYEIAGDALMRERIGEMEALRKLQSMSESDVFINSLGQTAAAPLRYGADLLTDPGQTLRRSASGIANLFDRVGAGIAQRSDNRDSVPGSVLGFDSARRTLAVQLGVDPYTDFPPLAAKLKDVASASALGGLSVKALLMVIPGGAGVAVSSVSTADTIRSTLAEKTAAQVLEQVQAMLARQKVSPSTISRLLANRLYTPTDLLLIAQSLATLKAPNTELFAARAAEAGSREECLFQRQRAMLLAKNARALAIGPFVDVNGMPLNRLRDGRLLALFPLDEVAWTERVARVFDRAQPAASAAPGRPVLATTGTVTPMATAELTQRGWTLQRVD